MPGAWTEIDQNNIVMASIEDLNEEEQRNYAALQEYIKQQFLVGIKKDRHDKISREGEFKMPSIKISNNKVEVLNTVSEPSSDLTAVNLRIENMLKS